MIYPEMRLISSWSNPSRDQTMYHLLAILDYKGNISENFYFAFEDLLAEQEYSPKQQYQNTRIRKPFW